MKQLGQGVFVDRDGKIEWGDGEVAYSSHTDPTEVTLDGTFEVTTLLKISRELLLRKYHEDLTANEKALLDLLAGWK